MKHPLKCSDVLEVCSVLGGALLWGWTSNLSAAVKTILVSADSVMTLSWVGQESSFST